MSQFLEILDQVRREITEESPSEVHSQIEDQQRLLVLDVREREEFVEGCLPGANLLPRGFLELKIEQFVPDKTTPIVVYCAGGIRSALAAKTLQDLGYTDVKSMAGGVNAWRQAGFSLVRPG